LKFFWSLGAWNLVLFYFFSNTSTAFQAWSGGGGSYSKPFFFVIPSEVGGISQY
jgi:hypothetical protein